MMRKTVTNLTWMLLLLFAVAWLAACSAGDNLLLAEYNRDGTVEIFLAKVGAEESEWQLLVEDAERALLFEGEFATFVPDTNRILLWYIKDNDFRVEQMAIGDDAPTELLEANANTNVFGSFESDPFNVYLIESRSFDNFRCYVSQDGAEARRLARGSRCIANENGVVAFDVDQDEVTVSLISLDGEEETVVLDELEDVGGNVRFNEALTLFAYVQHGRRDMQLFLIEPGDEAGEALGEAFDVINTFGFLGDDETVFLFGKPDSDDDELGLYINATGEALFEAEAIVLAGLSEDGDYAMFISDTGDEEALFVYNVADGSATEVVAEPSVTFEGFVGDGRFLLKTENQDDDALLSVSRDGSEVVELLETDDYDILFAYMNHGAEQLLVKLGNDERTDTLFVTGLNEADGYYLLEEWFAITILAASDEYLIFSGREEEGDDVALYSISWAVDSSEIELDDAAEFGYRGVFFAEDGRSLYYTMLEDGFDDTEVRRVPVDGSERPERLYRDMVLLDVSWAGEPNLQFIR